MGFQKELRGGLHLLSLLLLMVPLIDALIRAAVQSLASPMQGDGEVAEGAYTATLGSYKRMGRVVVFGVVVAFLAQLWDISLVTIASAGFGQQVATHLLRALLICVVGYLAWEAVRLTINRKLARERTVAGRRSAQDWPRRCRLSAGPCRPSSSR